uniref:VAMP-like protein YKT61 n=1 Tax=Aegilops tauschii TaxID=37682 RepID=M8D017_AEGTA
MGDSGDLCKVVCSPNWQFIRCAVGFTLTKIIQTLCRFFAEYKVHSHNRNGLCVVAFMDDHYPVRSAFSLLNKVLDEYQKAFGDAWKAATADSTQEWPFLMEALTKFQDPAEADKLTKIQRDLDETKIILHKTIENVLQRGERLDSLVEKSSDLSAASQVSIAIYLMGPFVLKDMVKNC